MLMIALISPHAHQLVQSIPGAYQTGVPAEDSTSMLVPVTTFLYQVILVNVMLAVFNLIPIPPLDGSHVLRHFLSDSVRSAYDNIGLLALFALMFLGGGLLSRVLAPFQSFFDWMLTSL
jgi:Zn-dependent protease